MNNKSRVFINPFDIPSTCNKANQPKSNDKAAPSNLTMHQKAAESLQSLANYNPTLSSSTTTNTHSYPYNTNQYHNVTTQNNLNHKRSFHAMNDTNHNNTSNKRRKRQRYPNDGGLTDRQYETIMEARQNETKQDVLKYIEQRKRNYPLHKNVERKREIINVKTKRGQLLSINERIMKYQDDTGNKKTPSVLRFLKTPKFDENIVRKVLKKEIEQEYSAILQCFRYIIKTNYLTTEAMDSNQNKEIQRTDDEQGEIINGNAFDRT
eukprot:292042_1